MAVTIISTVRAGANYWRIAWSSDEPDPTFYIYQDGQLVATTKLTTWTFLVPGGEEPVIEILDSSTELPQTAFSGRLTLAWERSADTDYYLIEEYVDASWSEVARVPDIGVYYYSWQTRFLEDVTTHQFRITPIGTNGNSGAVKSFSVLMVHNPAEPDVSYSYDSGTAKITISEA